MAATYRIKVSEFMLPIEQWDLPYHVRVVEVSERQKDGVYGTRIATLADDEAPDHLDGKLIDVMFRKDYETGEVTVFEYIELADES